MTQAPDFAKLPPKLRSAMERIAFRAKNAGGRAWLVGGAVRDLVLGDRDIKDIDIEVFGIEPDRLKTLVGEDFAFDDCGASFGVLKLKGLDIDVSLPRRESKESPGHRGFSIAADPTMPLRDAARRRDFTVNAIYADAITGETADPYGGMEDLSKKILRHVSERFTEDPLRVLRGMQFVARFGLEPAQETIEVCRTMTTENLAAERQMEEWTKLLVKGVEISRGLEFLRATGWVGHYPELAALIGCEQAKEWHPEGDVWNHTLCCLNAFARHRTGDRDEDLIVGLAVLCHDFGKPSTSVFDRAKGRITSKGHDIAGLEPAKSFIRRLTNEERLVKEVLPLVKNHMRPFAMWKNKSSDSAVRRLAAEVVRIDRLLRVAQADDEGRSPMPTEPEARMWLAERAEALRVADSAPKPILMGRHLLELGMKPSPEFKKILNAAFSAQLDGKFIDLEGALKFLKCVRRANLESNAAPFRGTPL